MRASSNVRGLMRMARSAPLPYSGPFLQAELAVIECALRQALLALRNSPDINVRTCGEVEITNELQRLLNRMLEASTPPVAGFSKAVFQSVVRGAELEDHDGRHPEKRPDLAFRSFRTLPQLSYPEQCVLLVECKVVDRAHPMSRYGPQGISRFVDGTYAWAVSIAMMLGYARDNYHPMTQLKRHLAGRGVKYAAVGGLQKRGTEVDSCQSVHERVLGKLPNGIRARITINHIWVTLD